MVLPKTFAAEKLACLPRPRPLFWMCAGALAVAGARAQIDSGWTSVHNGRNFDGLYIRSGTALLRNPATQDQVRIESDGSLHVANPSPNGAVCTKANLSRYHTRLQYQFASSAGTPNAGMLYHIDSLDYLESDAFGSSSENRVPHLQPSCGGSRFPKGWEAQMRRGQSGAIYGIVNVWGETTARSGRWDPQGTPHSLVPSYNSGPKNLNPSQGDWPDAAPNWVTMELLVYGADSAIHIVNGTRVFKMTRMRHNRRMMPCAGPFAGANDPDQKPLSNGKLCVQIEGAQVRYRQWQIRPLGSPVTALPAGGSAGPGMRARLVAGGVRIDCRLPRERAERGWRVQVRSPGGRRLRSLPVTGRDAGPLWDLADAGGRRVPAGIYLFSLTDGKRTLAAVTLALP